MAQEAIVTVKLWDDIYMATGRKCEADGTHTLRLDDYEIEIELDNAHFNQLIVMLKPYFEVGRKPEKRKSANKYAQKPAASVRPRRPREFYIGMRAFADEHGIRYMYSGKASFSATLVRQYEAYLREQASSTSDQVERVYTL
jgi:Lsr2